MAELNENKPVNQQPINQSESLSKEMLIKALAGVDNADLLDLLLEWRMENSLYIYPLMEMKGYEIDFTYEVVTFTSPKGEAFPVRVETLRDLCFRVVRERSVDFRLERLLGGYLQCNAQQTYCVFDQKGYFPNGSKEILATESPDVFIVDKQRKVAVSHETLLAKLNELLQLNEATNAKYADLWQAYRTQIAERYPEELACVLRSDEPLRSVLSKTFYHRDSYGECFIELSGKRVARIPVHVLKDLTYAKLMFVEKSSQEDQRNAEPKLREDDVPARRADVDPLRVKIGDDERASSRRKENGKSAKTSAKNTAKSSFHQGQAGAKQNAQSSNGRYNNARRGGRNNGRSEANNKRNAKFNTDRYLITEDELYYIIPVGWRNQLLNWGAFGQFILDVWIAFKLARRIRQDKE